jgi:hypothetical protein
MPEVRVFIRAEPWTRLLKECKGDDRAARQKIKQLVEEKYAA